MTSRSWGSAGGSSSSTPRVVAVTGSRTLVASDAGATLVSNGASNFTLSALPAGLGSFTIVQASTGTITVTPASGVTITGRVVTTDAKSWITFTEILPGQYFTAVTGKFPLAANSSAYSYAELLSLDAAGQLSECGLKPKAATWSAIQAAHDAVALLTNGGNVVCDPIVYTADVALQWNHAKVGLVGNCCRLNAAPLGSATAVVGDYRFPGAGWVDKSIGKLHAWRDFAIVGVGSTNAGFAGSVGFATDGTQDPLGVRVIMFNPFIAGFETLMDLRNRSYLQMCYSPQLYDAKFGVRQQAGTDSGENCQMMYGLINSVDLPFYCIDNSSEWTVTGMSFDYCRQIYVGYQTSNLFNLIGCHIELRGANLIQDDGNYVLDGTGYDPRAPVPGLDNVFDINGDGGGLRMIGGSLTCNNSGGNSPYDFKQVVMLRHTNSSAIFRDVKMSNWLNKNNCFWSGAGTCRIVDPILFATSSMPTRLTDQARGNALQDGIAGDGGMEDHWFITKDATPAASPHIFLKLVGGATALATVSGGAITAVTIVSGGEGYTSTPTVSFAGGGGSGASITAVMGNGTTTGPTDSVASFTGLTGGTGYTSAPEVVFSGGGGSGADAIVLKAQPGAPNQLRAGDAFCFYAPYTNTSTTPTVTIANFGAKTATSSTGAAVAAGTAWTAGALTFVVYDGTGLRLMTSQRTIGRNGMVQRSTTLGQRFSAISNLVGGTGWGSTGTTITVSGGGGTGMAFTPVVIGGVIKELVCTNLGTGYTSAPTLAASGTGSGFSATVVLTNTGAFKITKFNTGSFRLAIYTPCVPGERVSLRMLVHRQTTGGMTGSLFTELRWVKSIGQDALGRPVIVNQDAYSASGTLPTTLDQWVPHTQDVFNSGASGQPVAPSWATGSLIILNLDNGSANDLFVDDVWISRWA